jgi:hypothetical protein
MPQGGSGGKGNGGAGVTSNGGSKQKLRGKPKASSYKAQQQPAVAPGERANRTAPEAGQVLARGAHTIIAPRVDRRAKLVAAKRRGDRAEEELAARSAQRAAAVRRQPVLGTAPTGELLGGESPLPVRQARLQHLAKQQAEQRVAQRERALAAKAQRDAPYAAKQERARERFCVRQEQERRAAARAVSELPLLRQRREALLAGSNGGDAAGAGAAEVREHVALLLDMLAERLGGSGRAAEAEGEVWRCQRTLCKVLDNALKKAEPKFKRLKARNDKLWASLLQQYAT